MGTSNASGAWSAFDGVKSFRPTASPTASVSPDTLMAEIDAAIAATEHARSTALLRPFTRPRRPGVTPVSTGEEARPPSLSSSSVSSAPGRTGHDAAGLADEAYRSACAALAAGKPDSALRSLRVALASCPPDKPSAISKLRSLVAFATSQQRRLQQHNSSPPP